MPYTIYIPQANNPMLCGQCKGETTVLIKGSVKTCRTCQGKGEQRTLNVAIALLTQFRLPTPNVTMMPNGAQLSFLTNDVDMIVGITDALNHYKIQAAIVISGRFEMETDARAWIQREQSKRRIIFH